MSPGKHGPNRANAYFSIHQTIMDQLLRSGFVTSEDLLIESDGAHGYFMVGRVRCLGGIYIDVTKHIAHVAGDRPDPLIQTVQYGYNVALEGRGNIFRYDSPHPDHNRNHHRHQFDVLGGDTEGTVELIFTEDEIPTLRDVIREAEDWYYRNLDNL